LRLVLVEWLFDLRYYPLSTSNNFLVLTTAVLRPFMTDWTGLERKVLLLLLEILVHSSQYTNVTYVKVNRNILLLSIFHLIIYGHSLT
jgi:hypothetical protein